MSADIVVVGTGYVGITTAACFAHLGHASSVPTSTRRESTSSAEARSRSWKTASRRSSGRGSETGACASRPTPPAPQPSASSPTCACRRRRATTVAPTCPTSRPRPREIGAACCRPTPIVVNKSTVPVGSTRVVERGARPQRRVRRVEPRVPPRGLGGPRLPPPRPHRHRQRRPVRGHPGRRRCTSASPRRSSSPTRRRPRRSSTPPTPSSPPRSRFVNAVAAVCEAVGADVNDVVLGMGYDKRIGHEFLRPGPGWGGSLLPEGHRARSCASPRTRGYDFDLLEGRGRGQRGAVRPRRRQGRATWPADRSTACTVARVGPHVQGPHRRPARARPRSQIIARLLDARAPTSRAYDPAGRARRSPGRASRSCADPYAACEGAEVLVVLTEWDEFRWLDFDKVAGVDGSARPSSTPATCSTAPPCIRRGLHLPGHRPDAESAADVVVTGGAGFLGSHLCERAARPGRRGRRRSTTSSPARSATSSTSSSDAGFTFVEHDVSTYIWVAGTGRRRAALRQPGLADRLPRASRSRP